MGIRLARESARPPGERRRAFLVFAVGANLLLLGCFQLLQLLRRQRPRRVRRPLAFRRHRASPGISFFTFTQIAFLVDAWRGEAREFNCPLHLFVTYFPI